MQEPKHITHKNPSTPKHTQARPGMPKQLFRTYENLLNPKEHEIFDFKKVLRKKEEEQSSL